MYHRHKLLHWLSKLRLPTVRYIANKETKIPPPPKKHTDCPSSCRLEDRWFSPELRCVVLGHQPQPTSSNWGVRSEDPVEYCVGFEVLAAVTMKSAIFLNVICNQVEFHRCFGGTVYLRLLGSKIKSRYKPARKFSCSLLVASLAYSLNLQM
jgi:hypothetical protein